MSRVKIERRGEAAGVYLKSISYAEYRRAIDLTVRAVEREMRAHADLLRQTAAELDADSIHRCHAANRLRKIANEIARPTP